MANNNQSFITSLTSFYLSLHTKCIAEFMLNNCRFIAVNHRNPELWLTSAISSHPMLMSPSQNKDNFRSKSLWLMEGWEKIEKLDSIRKKCQLKTLQRSQDRSWRTCNAELKKNILKLTIIREGKVSQVSLKLLTRIFWAFGKTALFEKKFNFLNNFKFKKFWYIKKTSTIKFESTFETIRNFEIHTKQRYLNLTAKLIHHKNLKKFASAFWISFWISFQVLYIFEN